MDINDIANSLDFTSNSLVDCGPYQLTNYEIEILTKYDINYKNYTSLKDILFILDEILDEDNTLDDLENISLSISERDYYNNTNK